MKVLMWFMSPMVPGSKIFLKIFRWIYGWPSWGYDVGFSLWILKWMQCSGGIWVKIKKQQGHLWVLLLLRCTIFFPGVSVRRMRSSVFSLRQYWLPIGPSFSSGLEGSAERLIFTLTVSLMMFTYLTQCIKFSVHYDLCKMLERWYR